MPMTQFESNAAKERIEKLTRASIRAKLAAAGVRDEAIDDAVALIAPRVDINDITFEARVAGHDVDSPEFGERIADFLRARPNFRNIGNAGIKGDIARALREPEYYDQWNKSDPQSLQTAENQVFASLRPGDTLTLQETAAMVAAIQLGKAPAESIVLMRRFPFYAEEWQKRDAAGFAKVESEFMRQYCERGATNLDEYAREFDRLRGQEVRFG